jgi:hypothetical protein
MSMKPRHAAALAFVGWYLVVPPFRSKEYDVKAELSEWSIMKEFDTEKGCKDYPAHLERLLKEKHHGDGNVVVNKALFDIAQCIATGDPRLKKTK